MTEMKRVTIAFPEDIDARILEIKAQQTDKKSSYSEVVRQLVLRGLAAEEKGA